MVVPAWLLSTARLHPAPSTHPLGAPKCVSTPKLRRTKSAPSQHIHHQLRAADSPPSTASTHHMRSCDRPRDVPAERDSTHRRRRRQPTTCVAATGRVTCPPSATARSRRPHSPACGWGTVAAGCECAPNHLHPPTEAYEELARYLSAATAPPHTLCERVVPGGPSDDEDEGRGELPHTPGCTMPRR